MELFRSVPWNIPGLNNDLMGALKEENILELTFAKTYGEIDQYAFGQTDIFTKLRSLCFLIGRRCRGESRLKQQKYKTDLDINR